MCDKIGFIGAGKIAQAIMSSLVRNGIQHPEKISVYDISIENAQYCNKNFGVRMAANVLDVVRSADVVVLAVKPQNVEEMLRTYRTDVMGKEGIKPDFMLLSIIAGVPMKVFSKETGVEHVVRAMPNTPVTIEQGCTVWCGSKGLPPHKAALAARLFGSIGDEIFVEDEGFLDMATAISGSGPAYLYLTMEAMIDAGVHMGFPRHIAERLVQKTLLGSCLYAIHSGDHISKLRNDITSPGGTTASALHGLERGGFRATVSDAIWAAYRRSLELGGKDSNVGPGRSHGNPLPKFWQKDGRLRDDSD